MFPNDKRRPLARVGRRLARLGFGRSTSQISISRWPRGRRRMVLVATGLSLVAVTGAAATAGFLALGPDEQESPELVSALRACAAEPSCMEWRISARCEVSSLIGRLRSKHRMLYALGRSPQEAAWMITHFRPCLVEHVHEPNEISGDLRARLRG